MTNTQLKYAKLFPVMLCFFAMGFVDLVGIASNYVKEDLGLTDSEANIFPSLVFFWFLIFSVPTGILMNRIGRKKTVLLSLGVTFFSLLLPMFGDSYGLMLCSFSLLGIGNALMQTSLNPLLSNIISGDRLASTLTFGQFVKAIASFLAPYLAMWGALQAIPTFGLGWRVLFPIYMVVAVFAILLLSATPITEEQPDKASGFADCLKLLGKPFILLSFLGIMCHVGIDVGTNTTAPKILMERIGMTLTEAGFATSLYFIFRTLGCFSGAFILRAVSSRIFFLISAICMMLAMIGLFAFVMDTIGGVLLAKFMNLFLKKKINPMIGGAGISAFPMSSRVIQKMAMEEDPTNVILMQAAGANVSGQIASVIAGGMVINLAASCNQANTVMAALTIMGKGMAGIFAAILIILLLVWILRKVSR